MKIKEIAETYGIQYETINPDIVHSIVFDKVNAYTIIEKLRFECKPILGCDVYRLKDGEIEEILIPNMYCNKSDCESYSSFLQRSCDEALSFVENYPLCSKDIYFDFVIM